MAQTYQATRSWLGELNPQQLEAVTYEEGPLLVVAGAGSGKTKTLAYRVAYLISEGVPPERILLLTFTRRAAHEMLKRAASAVSTTGNSVSRVWGGTFHSVANRLLRLHAHSAGLRPDLTIMDRADAEDLLDIIRNEMGLSASSARFPRKSTCMDIYSRRVNGSEALQTVLEKYFPWCESWQNELTALFRSYVDRKTQHCTLDYDDLLLYWFFLLQDEEITNRLSDDFEHILVDEYQDTNKIQAGILEGMRCLNGNITVVGDDAQAIYSFRSATVDNMLEFPQRFSGTRIVKLEQNYRSIQPILETTNRVIAQARSRYSKELWSARKSGQRPQLISCIDENCQAETVVLQVLDHYEQGIPLHRQAVLFRASSHPASLELALTRKNIPFHKYGGLRFLESAHIRDLVSFLRIIENPRDQMAWFRVLQLLNGVGPVTASSAFEHVAINNYEPKSISTFRAPAAAREEMSELGVLLEEVVSRERLGASEVIERVRLFYTPLLNRNYADPEPRSNDIACLESLASGYSSVEQFLSGLILDPPASTGDLAGRPTLYEDWLVLSTIHSAKGLEWDVVYLINAADGCLPSDMAAGSCHEIEEELRLTYVAMTRARDFLYVLWPLRFYHRPPGASDSYGYAQRCRFLSGEVIETMDRAARGGRANPPDRLHALHSTIDVAGRIRDMWG